MVIDQVRETLANTLQLGARASLFDANTRLLGEIPELDSMAVVNLLTAMEDRFDIVIEDDEVTADIFVTLGSLVGFVETKLR